MKNGNGILSAALCAILFTFAGCVTAPEQAGAPAQKLAPLELFWNGHDHYTTATAQGETDAKAAGYHFVRIEGYVFESPQSDTIPLKQYWSAKRHDHMLLGKELPKTIGKRGDYHFVRIEGYAYSIPQPDTVPLKRFKHGARDNFTTATAQGENDALATGHVFQRIEAYVIPVPGNSSVAAQMPPTHSHETATVPQPIKIEAVSADQIRKWIAQLADSDFSNRESAINELAQHSDAALPALGQALKTETDDDRRWWVQSAIQECEENQPKPDEISASPTGSKGLQVSEACKSGDGFFVIIKRDGVPCWEVPKKGFYLYFSASDEFRQKGVTKLEIQVEYLDIGTGTIGLDYDSTDRRAAFEGAYKNDSTVIHCTNSGQWRKTRYHLPNARFRGSENCQTDFRFYNGGDDMIIRAVRVWPSRAAD
jgi:hypothetical protein